MAYQSDDKRGALAMDEPGRGTGTRTDTGTVTGTGTGPGRGPGTGPGTGSDPGSQAGSQAAGERIVLLDRGGRPVGTAPKASSHHRDTPFHLAFSSYLTDAAGRVLITRRALDKRTFPGVWTNTCCGHPAPGESLRNAVRRRLDSELGLAATSLSLVLPDFEYRAVAGDGVVEWEWCPVVTGRVADPQALRPDPAEVADAVWRTWAQCLALADDPDASPWYRMQLARLAPLGEPAQWPAADPAALPPALAW